MVNGGKQMVKLFLYKLKMVSDLSHPRFVPFKGICCG